MYRMIASLMALIIILATFGCGGASTTTVSGTITLDGKPLEKGTISFIGEVGEPILANIENGQFETPALAHGIYKIAVIPAADVIPPQSAEGNSAGDTFNPMARTTHKKGHTISEIYMDPESSGLKLDVKDGNNRFDYDFPTVK